MITPFCRNGCDRSYDRRMRLKQTRFRGACAVGGGVVPHLVVVIPVQAVGGRVGPVVRVLHEHRLVLHGDPLLVHAHHLTHGGRLAHGQEEGLWGARGGRVRHNEDMGREKKILRVINNG